MTRPDWYAMPSGEVSLNRKGKRRKPLESPGGRDGFAKLAETDARLRRQFIEAELATCDAALQFGEFELTQDKAVAKKELEAAEKVVRVVQRFLPKVAAKDRAGLLKNLAEKQQRIEQLRMRLYPGLRARGAR